MARNRINGGPDDDDLVGTSGDDHIRGEGGKDAIRGLGGNDRLNGHHGRDNIYGGDGHDRIEGGFGADYIEGGDGNDVIVHQAILDFAEGEVFIEDFHADTLLGGNGADSIYGGNKDLLTGGAGGDSFFFSSFASSAQSAATISDFNGNQDTLVIHSRALIGFNPNDFTADVFHAGSEAVTASQRIIYHAASDSLYYDPDGNGAGAQQLILNINVTAGTFNQQDIAFFS